MWFRNNLRILDNEALFKATRDCEEVYPVYVIDPRNFEVNTLGFQKTGPFRTKFLLESLKNLRHQLKKVGSELIICEGNPEVILPGLVDEWKIDIVYTSKEFASGEAVLQQRLEENMSARHILYETFWQHTLYHEEDVPWPIKQVPETFTTFRKESENMVQVRPEFPAPEKMNTPVQLKLSKIPTLGSLIDDVRIPDDRSVISFTGGEDAAWERLYYYFWESDLLKDYKNTRNGLMGGDYSSKLSPWLALGCISSKSVYREIKRYENLRKKNDSTYWLFFELLWRDFFRFMAKKHGENVFTPSGFSGTPPDYAENPALFESWCHGETGEPFVDANMKELLLTGYMSNRGRQITASYLIHDLGIRWTHGASWFQHRLIDYDTSSNWLNWAYIAGVGNDPRQGRHFSIESQSVKYDPKGKYVNYWLEKNAIS